MKLKIKEKREDENDKEYDDRQDNKDDKNNQKNKIDNNLIKIKDIGSSRCLKTKEGHKVQFIV